MYKRLIQNGIIRQLNRPEIIIINGARRVGKTTLIRQIKAKINRKSAYFDFTDPATQNIWSDFSLAKISRVLSDLGFNKDKSVLFFDEIQYFDNAGILFKLFFDHYPNVKIVATGSSSFLMLQNIGDSLTGRKKIYNLYPLSLAEIENNQLKNYWSFQHYPLLSAKLTEMLKNQLIYGSYPEVVNTHQLSLKIEKLRDIVDSYLYKDLLMIESIKQPKVIVQLTQLLAYQLGNLVNPNEIAATLGMSRDTILHYLDLLEKFFIVYRIYPYQENIRNVIKKKFKVYFYDLGIRNAVIGNFSKLEQRQDQGFLLENAVVTGLKRRISYDRKIYHLYFWRNYDSKEVDILIKKENPIGFEIKWQSRKTKIPKGFPAKAKVIDSMSAYRFIL